MGNAAGKLNHCFCPAAGDISRRHDIAVVLSSTPLDDGIGHSFCYIRPPDTFAGDDQLVAGASALPTISGASVSANTSTPLSTALFDPFFPISASLDRAASFESTPSFAAVPLQPIPRHLINSGPLLRTAGSILGSGPIERGFLSGPIERGFMSGPIPLELDLQISGNSKNKFTKWSAIRELKDTIMGKIWGPKTTSHKRMINQNDSVGRTTVTTSTSSGTNLSSLMCDENGDDSFSSDQWAQGKAGEDRVHVVVSEEHGWVFVGIYDGFNGPDATDFLLSNLYTAVHKELKGVLWNDETAGAGVSPRCCEHGETSPDKGCRKWRKKKKNGKVGCSSDRHSAVLGAMSAALRRTEAAYLDIADKMIVENPVLSLMGSCVLVMLMSGDDVYLMNVGDSRAVLGQRSEIESSSSTIRSEEAFDDLPSISSVQLTMDHNTLVKEEVQRIRNEHPDDQCAVTNERVKGSLKVTRAFGAGFLKNPKWNKGLLEMFRIDYVGQAPYITCSPSLHHHQLGPKDRFLILSSDGLYQYFTNEEATAAVELFMMLTPEGDPAQHLVEEVLFRTAKKAGMDFHELLDIPQGERRRYHDDVSIIIISFEGRIWRSSV